MDSESKRWIDRPMYATWPGRILFLLVLVVPDILKTVAPGLWIEGAFRWFWYAALLIIASIFQWRASRKA
jgi:hypothetical protein